MPLKLRLAAFAALILAACNGSGDAAPAASGGARPFAVRALARFEEPWAMTFLPDGRALVTEKAGRLLIWKESGSPVPVAGVPKVAYGGQLGLGDVVLHPAFARNRLVYLSWSEEGPGDTRGPVVGRARLVEEKGSARLDGLQVIWRAEKVDGRYHHSHRIAFSPDGKLFITSGERMKFTPAQDLNSSLGKVIRLNDDGSVPGDNPFASRGGVAATVWSLGHRNLLGLAFDAGGRLWEDEMGPKGGDEVNLIERGGNYGWPAVSNGDNYDGSPIPDHPTRPEFAAPKVFWNPSISPSSLMIYSGRLFPEWRGSAFIGALSGKALIRVALDGSNARKADQWDMGQRIREVEQGPDGAIYLLEDAPGGRLLRLTPAGRR
ncbi:MAG: PQQ-dependent sugar dehydrogenase [Alphaproteobacteria bacterium]|nr:PQQ-dependent sugar dehydrogenase [Alphaproteobacteria bacterium]MBV9370934.1 PQQ-dependent sugar dehydrogenase [Alphaproteobacteria bacterium]MBV9901136.1 PQQ-dependent sugar dehydrogenase [Alphaproteobacteria bacterium]